MTRIYQDNELHENDSIKLNERNVHHILNVLRLSENDNITIFNGKGGEFSAKIAQCSKRNVSINVEKFHNIERESPLNIHLAQSVSRSEKMDFIIQKVVELGTRTITPILSERCGVKLSEERWQKRMEHWKNIIISACEQCGRNTLPALQKPISLNDWITQSKNGLKLILNPNQGESISNIKQSLKKIILLIGPEGGFSDTEISLALQQHFQSIKLGARILRTETAAIAASAILQALYGDI